MRNHRKGTGSARDPAKEGKEAGGELAVDKMRQQQLLETMSEIAGIGIWENNFVTGERTWSNGIFRIMGLSAGEQWSLEKVFASFLPPYDTMIRENMARMEISHQPWDLEMEILTANHERKWVRSIGKPLLDHNGNLIGVTGVFQDIDDRKGRDLKLEAYALKIRQHNERLQHFAHAMSHNLRTHAGNVNMLLEYFIKEPDPQQKKEWLDYLVKASKALNQSLHELTDIVKLDVGADVPVKRLDFRDAIEHNLSSLQLEIASAGIQLSLDIKTTHIDYPPAYLDSILLNTITNAIKYRDKASTPFVQIRTYTLDTSTWLEISDNGIGIDLEQNGDRLFGLYQRFTDEKDSVGIGLYIIKTQVESMGGFIKVKSKPGEGTTFYIKLN